MLRALILLVLVTSFCAVAPCDSAVRPALGRSADLRPHLVEGVSPRFVTVAMTII